MADETSELRRIGTSPLQAIAGRIEVVRPLVIAGFQGTCAVQCPCGTRKALLIPFIVGIATVAECIECGRIFRITRFDFDSTKPPNEQFTIRVSGQDPVIERPKLT